jgi:hypothetical protein
MRFVATLVAPEVLHVSHALPIGHGSQFSGCLPLMEDTAMRVESLVIPTHS